MASVAWAATFTNVAFLWHNVIGAVAVVVVGLVVSSRSSGRLRWRREARKRLAFCRSSGSSMACSLAMPRGGLDVLGERLLRMRKSW